MKPAIHYLRLLFTILTLVTAIIMLILPDLRQTLSIWTLSLLSISLVLNGTYFFLNNNSRKGTILVFGGAFIVLFTVLNL